MTKYINITKEMEIVERLRELGKEIDKLADEILALIDNKEFAEFMVKSVVLFAKVGEFGKLYEELEEGAIEYKRLMEAKE